MQPCANDGEERSGVRRSIARVIQQRGEREGFDEVGEKGDEVFAECTEGLGFVDQGVGGGCSLYISEIHRTPSTETCSRCRG